MTEIHLAAVFKCRSADEAALLKTRIEKLVNENPACHDLRFVEREEVAGSFSGAQVGEDFDAEADIPPGLAFDEIFIPDAD